MANYSQGLWTSDRYNVGAFYFNTAGHIGAFYFGPDAVTVSAGELDLWFECSATEAFGEDSGGQAVNVTPQPLDLFFELPQATALVYKDVAVDFVGSPRAGNIPLEVSFSASTEFLGWVTREYGSIDYYNWYFDYDRDLSVSGTSTLSTYSYTYSAGYSGKTYSVYLEVGLGDGALVRSEYKPNYIRVCGAAQPVRFGASRDINLTNFLPDSLKSTQTYDFTQFFEDYLNTMFTGLDGYTISEDNSDPVKITYNNPANLSTKDISILEKINRITELQDPALIDLDYIQYFANNLGYQVDINRGQLGTLVNADAGACSAIDEDKYIRFVVENLPSWYKIKSTRNAVKVMLYSFGLIADISTYYTDSYLPESEGGQWVAPDYTMVSDSIASIPDGYYPTPHFIVWVDGDASTEDLSWDFDKKEQVIAAIESIRPINTVFRNLGVYYKRVINMYLSGYTRFRRYIKISSEGASDYWK